MRRPEAAAPLAARLHAIIREAGPMPLARYMDICLNDPDHGYYATRRPIGAGGDFTTAPEVSQMFGELIGVWCMSAWAAMGRPVRFALVEIGPGGGTLMADMQGGPDGPAAAGRLRRRRRRTGGRPRGPPPAESPEEPRPQAFQAAPQHPPQQAEVRRPATQGRGEGGGEVHRAGVHLVPHVRRHHRAGARTRAGRPPGTPRPGAISQTKSLNRPAAAALFASARCSTRHSRLG